MECEANISKQWISSMSEADQGLIDRRVTGGDESSTDKNHERMPILQSGVGEDSMLEAH